MEKEYIKIERTDADVDNSQIIAKVPTVITDDFGTEYTIFKKQTVDTSLLLAEKATLEARLIEINETLLAIKNI